MHCLHGRAPGHARAPHPGTSGTRVPRSRMRVAAGAGRQEARLGRDAGQALLYLVKLELAAHACSGLLDLRASGRADSRPITPRSGRSNRSACATEHTPVCQCAAGADAAQSTQGVWACSRWLAERSGGQRVRRAPRQWAASRPARPRPSCRRSPTRPSAPPASPARAAAALPSARPPWPALQAPPAPSPAP